MSYILEQYDDNLKRIYHKGNLKKNRTGVDTLSIHGVSQRFDISEHFPVPTRRKYPFKSIIGELLWFLSGSTNVFDLEQNYNSKIWNLWRDEKFEQRKRFVHGALGPIYGFQLRNFNGIYFGGEKQSYPYIGQTDQLKRTISLLKNEPWRRDIFWSLWNPAQVDQMRLPPCHLSFQCLVNDGVLDGILTQRSGDFPIGIPANIIFYSALIYMLAQQCDLKPGELIHNIGDAHIYLNQLGAIREYLSRQKYDCPKLLLNKAKDIDSYTMDDFKLTKFQSGDKLSIEVTV